MVNVMRLISEAVHRKIIMKQETGGLVGIYSVPIPIISRGLVAFKDSIPQHKQFYPEHLSVFVPFPLGWINKVSTKIQGLFRTDCNFQRISRP